MYLDVVVLGALAGWCLGGRLVNLAWLPLRGLGGFLALGALELTMQFTRAPERRLLYQALILAAAGVALALLWLNRRLPGASLVLAGLVLNLLVMAVNGGRMPVSAWAAAASGQTPYLPELLSGTGARHVLLTAATRLPFLADIIPLPAPYPVPRVLSVGDLLVFAGVIRLLVYGMRLQPEDRTGGA